MFNFIVENPISTLKTFPTNISTSFPQLQYIPIFSNFFCKFFPTLNCGINFYLCGENLYVFIFIILSQLFFNLKLNIFELSTNVENFVYICGYYDFNFIH